VIARTCWPQSQGQCVSIDNLQVDVNSTLSVKCCNSDLCNTASLAGFSVALVMATLFGALCVKY